MLSRLPAIALTWLFLVALAHSQDTPEFTHAEDVIYGRKFGVALTMDVFQPQHSNGLGVIWIASGGWFSAKEMIAFGKPLIHVLMERGYTIFAVMHGSQPKFTIPEITQDVHRAVRFIRHHAKTYGIDPGKIGVTGGSAGGHLSLVLATQGGKGSAVAADAIDRESSAVQAVACLFPPTDFLNYGKPGEDGVGFGVLKGFKAAFGPRADDPEERKKLGHEISPIYFVTSNLPPTLIIHGDADLLVPIQQAETFVDRAREAGATAKLIVREGQGHGWKDPAPDWKAFTEWFDEHLRGIKPER